jgi:two-component system sensor histidine kinase/response regulator
MTTSNAPQANILVVDDTPANLNVLSTILTQQGYKVRPANSGEVALVVAQHAAPDLILLDIQMPGMNGFEVCRRLKALDQTRGIPVIFISALDEVLDKVEAFEAGGADYITKPFQILEVLARAEHQLALQRQRAQIAAARTLIRTLQGQADQLVGHAETHVNNRAAPLSAEQQAGVYEAAKKIQTAILDLARLLEDQA